VDGEDSDGDDVGEASGNGLSSARRCLLLLLTPPRCVCVSLRANVCASRYKHALGHVQAPRGGGGTTRRSHRGRLLGAAHRSDTKIYT
jgi:hypothetical protein